MLLQTFSQWPKSPAAILHPAASLLPSQVSFSDEASTSSVSLNGTTLDHDSSNTVGKDSLTSNGTMQEESSSPSSASPNTATAALALSSRFQREGQGELSIRDADIQAFFPSKRRARPEWGGSWGKRLDTKHDVERERRILFSMLEDFEGQPPFTIQRLSELILRPTEHHHTLAKYVSAIKRLLSVTATRDAFPAFSSEEEETLTASAISGETINGNGNAATASLFRSRSGTPVPGSPSTAPLFSPIPFLMKSGDEGMPGQASGVDGMSMEDGDMPGMELGGADRTSENGVEMAKRSGAGAGTGTSGRAMVEMNGSSTNEAEKHVAFIQSASESTPPLSAQLPIQNSDVTNAGNGPSSNTPLGVPSGMVDELDQLGQKHGQLPPVDSGSLVGGAKAFTSTTSTLSKEQSDETSPIEDDSIRALKRVKSERDLSSLEKGDAANE